MSEAKVLEIQVGRDVIRFETGEVAPLASGSVMVSTGDNMMMVAAVVSKEQRDLDFFPLTVDYESKMYAVGRFPGGFIRREGRPSENAILSARVTDRQIRPLFPDGFRNDVQVVAHLLSSDQENQTDILGMLGTSVALSISEIPFKGPTAAVRIGRLDGEWIINPTFTEVSEGDLDLIIAGTRDSINMVEAGAKMLTEAEMLEAIALGQEEINKIVDQISAFAQEVGKPKMEYTAYQVDENILHFISEKAGHAVQEAMQIADKSDREDRMKAIRNAVKAEVAQLPEDSQLAAIFANRPKDIGNTFYKLEKHFMRAAILDNGLRIDGRKPDEVRHITCKVGFVPRTHGSALFTRGNTQAMSLTTLGSMSDAQMLDNTEPEVSKHYLHHYNFPGYCVGEPKPQRGSSRREIGHGNLAERAILPVLPSQEDFPYALRVVSEVMASNGSSSMASTCGSTLTLMDAGVPIKAMVGGVAMGLIKTDDRFEVLTDIQGVEDHLGDMDFKVTGTPEGITALQMDIKVDGLSQEILAKALEQARQARLHILDKMREALDAPRAELSQHAPRIITMKIEPEKIGDVIGPGGKMIKQIVEETGVKIDIDDSGTVYIVTSDAESAEAAQKWIRELTAEAEVGKSYAGKVVRLTTFGAFIEVLPKVDGLLHISKVPGRPRNIEDVFSVGETVQVKVDEIDSQKRVNLMLDQEVEVPESAMSDRYEPRGERNDREGGRRDDRRDGGGRSGSGYGNNRGGGGESRSRSGNSGGQRRHS